MAGAFLGGRPWRAGALLDTCHLFAGYLGYPIADPTFNTTARTETQKFQGGELTISDFLGSVECTDGGT